MPRAFTRAYTPHAVLELEDSEGVPVAELLIDNALWAIQDSAPEWARYQGTQRDVRWDPIGQHYVVTITETDESRKNWIRFGLGKENA